MKILVDTSFWSAVLRRKDPDAKAIEQFSDMIENDELFVTGIIVQELLSYIPKQSLYDEIENVITGIGYIEPDIDDYLLASKLSNELRHKGVSSGTIDLLIAAIAIRRNMHLLSNDKDFIAIEKHTKLNTVKR